MNNMSIVRIIRKYKMLLDESQKKKIIYIAILMIIGGMFEMFSVSLIIPFVDAVMDPSVVMNKWYADIICDFFGIESERKFVVVIALLLALLYIVKNIYLLFEYNLQFRFVYENMFQMQSEQLNGYIHKPYEYFMSINSGEVIRVINNDIPGTFSLLYQLLNIFTEVIISVMLIMTLLVIVPLPTVCMGILLVTLMLLINCLIKPMLRRAGIDTQYSSAGMNKWLIQCIEGIKEIKIMGREEFFQNNFDSFGGLYANSVRKNNILNIVPRFMIEGVSLATMFVVIAMMILLGNDFENIISIVTMIATAAIRLLPSVNRMSSGIAMISYYEPMLDKLLANLKENNNVLLNQIKDDHHRDEIMREIKCEDNFSMIEINHISYKYPNSKFKVLCDVNLNFHSGDSIGIIGVSGAGKTTLVDIVLGLLKPESGDIFKDGISIYNDIHGWQKKIGYIPQNIFLLDSSIKNNIAFGIPEDEISIEKVWNAIDESALRDYVNSLPDGINTEIGERGIRLSGGQRQRIGIARALYSDPSILVFDEATSALDINTEHEIMRSIDRLYGKKTLLIIAHRLSTIENCDFVYEVKDKIVVPRKV